MKTSHSSIIVVTLAAACAVSLSATRGKDTGTGQASLRDAAALRDIGFFLPVPPLPASGGDPFETRPYLRDVARILERRFAEIIAPAWRPASGRLLFVPVPGNRKRPDCFVAHYRVQEHDVTLVVGEFRATIVVRDEASRPPTPIRSAEEARQAYKYWLGALFTEKPRTGLLVRNVGRYRVAYQRTRSSTKTVDVFIPWDWPESVKAVFDERGDWRAFSLDYHLPRSGSSMPAGGRGRAWGTWFGSIAAEAGVGRKDGQRKIKKAGGQIRMKKSTYYP